jgi:hypothetical protein
MEIIGYMTDILYRTDSADRFRELPGETFKDIALSEVIGFMASDQEDQGILKDIMTKIPTDISDMKYRQDIVKDLMANQDLCKAIKESISSIKVLRYYGSGQKRLHDRDNSLSSLLEELRECVDSETLESLKEEGLACKLSEIDGWKNKAKALAFDKGAKKETFTGIWSMAIQKTQTKESTSKWDSI